MPRTRNLKQAPASEETRKRRHSIEPAADFAEPPNKKKPTRGPIEIESSELVRKVYTLLGKHNEAMCVSAIQTALGLKHHQRIYEVCRVMSVIGVLIFTGRKYFPGRGYQINPEPDGFDKILHNARAVCDGAIRLSSTHGSVGTELLTCFIINILSKQEQGISLTCTEIAKALNDDGLLFQISTIVKILCTCGFLQQDRHHGLLTLNDHWDPAMFGSEMNAIQSMLSIAVPYGFFPRLAPTTATLNWLDMLVPIVPPLIVP